jgi:hypothetical protein
MAKMNPLGYLFFAIGVLLSPVIFPVLYTVSYAQERRRRKTTEPPKSARKVRSLSNAGDQDIQQL